MLGLPQGDRGGEALNLTTPLGDEVLSLRAGDQLTLSGTIYTARDEAHLRMMAEGIPFDPEGAVVYHCGPVVQNGRLVVAGPTTSARMNALTGFLIDAGVRALIGKGGMGAEVVEQLRGRAVYLALTGGCAALAADRPLRSGLSIRDLWGRDGTQQPGDRLAGSRPPRTVYELQAAGPLRADALRGLPDDLPRPGDSLDRRETV